MIPKIFDADHFLWSRQSGLGTLSAILCKYVFKIMFVIYVGVNLQTIKLT